MDPVTALGVVSAVFSFVTFTKDLIKTAFLIHDSVQTDHVGVRSRESIVTEMERFASNFDPPGKFSGERGDEGLRTLAKSCREVSKQLIQLLDSLKPKDPSSKVQSFRAILATSFHQKTLVELEGRLDACRTQLHVQFTYYASKRTSTLLDSLVTSSGENGDRIKQLHTSLEELRSDRAKLPSFISEEAESQFRQLIGIHQDALLAGRQGRIIRSLRFDKMNQRFEAVDEAHARNFASILDLDSSTRRTRELPEADGDSNANGDSDSFEWNNRSGATSRKEARQNFWDWMSSPGGIFHISGKPGSGKSTLMKLLVESQETREGLEKWAGKRKLAFASFFFWKPGESLQKSFAGLLRSLLHDVLKGCPGLIPSIMPDAWERASRTSWYDQSTLEISGKDIRNGFGELFKQPGYCFCFFIDGLDEFEPETAQHDHKHIVDTLNGWQEGAPSSLKLCLSSREENVFIYGLKASSTLRLQDLTAKDMQKYISDKLQGIPQKSRACLVPRITSKADGIFLWVALVVRTVREKAEDGAELEGLMAYIDSLPRELDELFSRIIKSIKEMDLKRAYRIFAMLSLATKYKAQPPFLAALPFLDAYEKDPNFAIRGSRKTDQQLTPWKSHLEGAYRRLNGWCKGLVNVPLYETSSDAERADEITRTISFTHRSVPEFLEKPHIRTHMETELQGFNTASALSQIMISAASFISTWLPGEEGFRAFDWVPMEAALLCLRVGDESLYGILDYLSDQHEDLYSSQLPGRPEIAKGSRFRLEIKLCRTETLFALTLDPLQTQSKLERVVLKLSSIILVAALFNGNNGYHLQQLAKDPRLTNSPFKVALIAAVSVMNSAVTVYLLSQRIITPHLEAIVDPVSNDRLVDVTPKDGAMTVWDSFLIANLNFWLDIELGVETDGGWDYDSDDGQKTGWQEGFTSVLEKFLEYGADSHFSASADCVYRDGELYVCVKCRFGKLQEAFDFRYVFQRVEATPVTLGRLQWWIMGGQEAKLTLRRWIQDLDPPNKHRLFWLMDRNDAMARGWFSSTIWRMTAPTEPVEILRATQTALLPGSQQKELAFHSTPAILLTMVGVFGLVIGLVLGLGLSYR
ncbi:hypothetical protein B0T25DRAFT_474812 [Lasiosphaeria hispida]|uniref:NACHT domain-containing protein n=1 Tax=Lasiosphaeria hispida TaxID=260671 RepID=A0AAJ0HL30_9PEZI|nr:hypothetical protein B0T25DRAFT_474812 [Lasiosphaeria hispida]